MPRGIPGSGTPHKKAVPPGTEDNSVRPQITQMSGHSSAESLLKEIPDSTTEGTTGTPLPGERKKREPKVKPPTDENMADPRYARIVGSYVGLGGQAVVSGLFDGASVALKDETVKLNPDEEQRVDDYFYIAGKKAKIDPTSTLAGMIIIFLVLMGSLLMPRIMKHTDLGKMLKDAFKPKPKPGLISKEEAMVEGEEK
jgi:hypothetical protein